MDFGGGSLTMDGLLSSASSDYLNAFGLFPDFSQLTKHSTGSPACSKHGRSSVPEETDQWARLKMPRLDPATTKPPACLLRSSSPLFPDGEKMLSFSSSKPDSLLLNSDWTLPVYHHPSSSSSSSAPSYSRNSGLGSIISSNASNMHGVVAGTRGPFTPSQWMELEHQALIYKYIDAKVPIPSNLLLPIRQSINAVGFTAFNAAGPYRSAATLGWGSFHPGFSASADPEPGRCRRTDGKKWRCSRDAVPDQKYCERHMNRGRHRSRKHVEGHNGHAAKAAMPAIPSSQSASAVSSGGSSNNITIAQQHSKSLQPRAAEPSPVPLDRLQMNKENTTERSLNSQGISILNNLSPKTTATLFPTSKQQNPLEGTEACSDLGLISSNDSLLNPRGRSYLENIGFVMSSPEMNAQHPTRSHSLRHFIDDWPKDTSGCSTITWPIAEKMRSVTQLSISVPMASSEFSSSSSSPNQDRLSFSPHEFNLLNDGSLRPSSWIPISWEPTIGGPLGEVLTNKSSTSKDLGRNLSSSSLNLLTDGWNSSPRLESSPTGVLQKTGLGSLSSSAGSSPRAGNHKGHEGDASPPPF